MKLIDKDALVAEIERLLKEHTSKEYRDEDDELIAMFEEAVENSNILEQEEPIRRTSADIESAMQEVEEKSNAFTEAHKGESADEILAEIRGEEPVSKPIDFEKELYKAFGQVKDFTLGMRIAKWFYDMGKNSQEPVSEELEIAAEDCVDGEDYSRIDNDGNPLYDGDYLIYMFEQGAQWQKNNLWKDAQGDDLPEYDREVVVFTQNFPDDAGIMSVAIGHRPNPDGWDGKSLSTGKVEHYTPKTYDKGGWNIPDVKYWLDTELPIKE